MMTRLLFKATTRAWIVPLTALAGALGAAPLAADATFTVRQTFSVPVQTGAKQVRGWFWMPEDRPDQRVLDFRVVSAPANFRITQDPRYGRSWIYAEAPADPANPMTVVTEFTVLRKNVAGLARPEEAGPIGAEHKRAFADELRRDEKHMEVTPRIQKIADELAGGETNPVLQAQKFFHFVIEKSEHYSKTGGKVKGLALGSAEECLNGNGDTCTDQHALFIALCRARDIPSRLMYGSRLRPDNEGKDHDPGYRCWPSFFAPGLGWVPLDVSAGDTAPAGRAEEWFGGIDANRIEWAEGRDFELEPRSNVRPDLVIRGWVEIDGKPFSDFKRTVNFTRQPVVAAPKAVASRGSVE